MKTPHRAFFPFLCLLSLALVRTLSAADSSPAAKAPAPVASVQGKWTAEFETMVGMQKYTYEFKVEAGKLTGTANGDQFSGPVPITGTVEGNKITFTEKEDIGGMDVTISYQGELKGDDIAFTREVGEFATEELVAKRVKSEAPVPAAPAKKN
jgi:hypothetical protein